MHAAATRRARALAMKKRGHDRERAVEPAHRVADGETAAERVQPLVERVDDGTPAFRFEVVELTLFEMVREGR